MIFLSWLIADDSLPSLLKLNAVYTAAWISELICHLVMIEAAADGGSRSVGVEGRANVMRVDFDAAFEGL